VRKRKNGENLAPLCPTPQKDALMPLSVLDSVLSTCDADDKIVKSMDKLQNFVSKVYNTVLYKAQSTPIIRNNENNISRSLADVKMLCRLFLLIVVHHIIGYGTL